MLSITIYILILYTSVIYNDLNTFVINWKIFFFATDVCTTENIVCMIVNMPERNTCRKNTPHNK